MSEKKNCLLKETLMDFIPEAQIDALLEKMRKELRLPNVLKSYTKYPNTFYEEDGICFGKTALQKWKETVVEWLGPCTHPHTYMVGEVKVCTDCKEIVPKE